MTVNMDGVERMVRERSLDIARRLGDEFVNAAQQLAPRRTGAGADSIVVDDVSESESGVSVRVVVGEEYMRFQNEGTGIHGPLGTPIVPVSAKVLVFDSPILGLTFAPSVQGTEPTHWWDRTVQMWPQIVRSAT